MKRLLEAFDAGQISASAINRACVIRELSAQADGILLIQ
jgi:hypothetical protein